MCVESAAELAAVDLGPEIRQLAICRPTFRPTDNLAAHSFFFGEIFLQRLIKLTQDSDAILFTLSKQTPWHRQCQLFINTQQQQKITARLAFAVKAAAALRRESECVLI